MLFELNVHHRPRQQVAQLFGRQLAGVRLFWLTRFPNPKRPVTRTVRSPDITNVQLAFHRPFTTHRKLSEQVVELVHELRILLIEDRFAKAIRVYSTQVLRNVADVSQIRFRTDQRFFLALLVGTAAVHQVKEPHRHLEERPISRRVETIHVRRIWVILAHAFVDSEG